MSKQAKDEQTSALSNFDIFGVDIGLVYKKNRKFTSRWGGLVSIMLMGLLLALGIQLITQQVKRENPNTGHKEFQVSNPSRYDLTINRFSFMISLLNDSKKAFIDPEIYTLSANFRIRRTGTTADGTIQSSVQIINLNTGPCTKEDFQFDQIRDFFLKIDYQNYICIKDQDQIFLQGKFDGEIFTNVQILISECSGPQCKDPQTRQQALVNAQAQIYLTDRVLDQASYTTPFTAVGKALFYNLFYQFQVNADAIYKSQWVYDDIGIVASENEVRKELFFADERVQLSNKTGNNLFLFAIYLQKDKEDVYYRTYLKIPQIISQLGGIFNVLFFVGNILSRPYNRIQLLSNLFHDVFQIEDIIGSNPNAELIIGEKKQENKASASKNDQGLFINQFKCCRRYFSKDITSLVAQGQDKLNEYLSVDCLIQQLIEVEKILRYSSKTNFDVEQSKRLTNTGHYNQSEVKGKLSLSLKENVNAENSPYLQKSNQVKKGILFKQFNVKQSPSPLHSPAQELQNRLGKNKTQDQQTQQFIASSPLTNQIQKFILTETEGRVEEIIEEQVPTEGKCMKEFYKERKSPLLISPENRSFSIPQKSEYEQKLIQMQDNKYSDFI